MISEQILKKKERNIKLQSRGVYHKEEQVMKLVDVDEVMYYVEERLMLFSFVENLDVNPYYYLLMFEEFEYNHLEHIEEVYDRYYQQ